MTGAFAVFYYQNPKITSAGECQLFGSIFHYCIPMSVTRGQKALVVSKYLRDHPATLNEARRPPHIE